jgi:hypothetical protein
MILFNPTRRAIKAKAGGLSYLFPPGSIKEIPDQVAANHLLGAMHPVGLCHLGVGADKEAIAEEGRAALAEFIEENLQTYASHVQEQAQQGFKRPKKIQQLESLRSLYKQMEGRDFAVREQATGPAQLADLVGMVSRMLPQFGDSPELQELQKALGKMQGKIDSGGELDPETVTTSPTGAKRSRINHKKAGEKRAAAEEDKKDKKGK